MACRSNISIKLAITLTVYALKEAEDFGIHLVCCCKQSGWKNKLFKCHMEIIFLVWNVAHNLQYITPKPGLKRDSSLTILLPCTHSYVVQKLYEFLSSVEHGKRTFLNVNVFLFFLMGSNVVWTPLTLIIWRKSNRFRTTWGWVHDSFHFWGEQFKISKGINRYGNLAHNERLILGN